MHTRCNKNVHAYVALLTSTHAAANDGQMYRVSVMAIGDADEAKTELLQEEAGVGDQDATCHCASRELAVNEMAAVVTEDEVIFHHCHGMTACNYCCC